MKPHASIPRLMPLGLLTLCAATGLAQAPFVPNYDESKVPQYTLPEVLSLEDGRAVKNAAAWMRERRPEVLRLFETHVYGRSAGKPDKQKFKTTSVDENALGGKATRKEITVYFTGDTNGPGMDILLHLPNHVKTAPVFVGLNFYGNHTVHADPGITLSQRWMRSNAEKGVVNHRATEASRGTSASRWPVERFMERGFGLATIYCGDLEPDSPEGWKDGIRAVFLTGADGRALKGHGAGDFAPDAWGAIGAWAWGLSRAMDYFETDPGIDAARVAVIGHSRLGKTALWAGAQDERFAIVISNESGCGGAALSRRRYGETVRRINTNFPHWFCGTFKNYNEKEDELPVDQHMLIALIAPRPVYVASAEEDRWADPKGEFLAARHAEPVYQLFGKEGLDVRELPAVNQPVGKTIGYHVRTGRHDVTDFDWDQYLDFAARHFKSVSGESQRKPLRP